MSVSSLIKLQASDLQLIKKETLAQVFSCELCEILKSTYFEEHLPTTASELVIASLIFVLIIQWFENLSKVLTESMNVTSFAKFVRKDISKF